MFQDGSFHRCDAGANKLRDLERLLLAYVGMVDDELFVRMKAWPPQSAHVYVHEAIGGLLARQATLTKELAQAVTLWNCHAAPLILKAMAEVHINLAWLLGEPVERCLKYISFGLSAANLDLENQRLQFGDWEQNEEAVRMFNMREQWLARSFSHLRGVDLSKFSVLSVRQMAEEAGRIDFYFSCYSNYSACASSMWHHVEPHNLLPCADPMPRHHRHPVSTQPELDSWYFYEAARYWNASLGEFDASTGVHVDVPRSLEMLENSTLYSNSSPADQGGYS